MAEAAQRESPTNETTVDDAYKQDAENDDVFGTAFNRKIAEPGSTVDTTLAANDVIDEQSMDIVDTEDTDQAGSTDRIHGEKYALQKLLGRSRQHWARSTVQSNSVAGAAMALDHSTASKPTQQKLHDATITTQPPPISATADNVVRPGKFVNARSLKRKSSRTISLPVNYREFLSEQEIRVFADMDSTEPVTDIDRNQEARTGDDDYLEPKPKTRRRAAALKSLDLASASSAKRRKVTNTTMDSDDSVDGEHQIKQDSPYCERHDDAHQTAEQHEQTETTASRDNTAVENKSKRTRQTAKSKNTKIAKAAAQSKPASKKPAPAPLINSNFRALKLRNKSGTSAGRFAAGGRFGRSAFSGRRATDAPMLSTNKFGETEEPIHITKINDAILETSTDETVIDFIFSDRDAAGSDAVPVMSNNNAIVAYVNLELALKRLCGLDGFLEEGGLPLGQREAIVRILAKQSTLVVLPTGGGKSLCYQLTSFIMRHVPNCAHSISLVISPTISLMHDQMQCLPAGIRAACLSSSNQSIYSQLETNNIDILFVAPERLQSVSFLELLHTGKIPTIRVAFVDEAHCMSEWSHNFRVSTDENRDATLAALLRTAPYQNLDSIIVYTMFQAQADRLAQYLRVRDFDVDSYHAGKLPDQREYIQRRFLQGKLRIIIATIAFGLGINKSNVRSVIHYTMPKSIEDYIQEIGRAGRDGLPAYCHLFLSQEDYVKHRSFAFGDGVDEAAVWRLLDKVFADDCQKKDRAKMLKRLVLPVEALEIELDMRESVLSTLLSYIEIMGRESCRALKVLPGVKAKYAVYCGKSKLDTLAETSELMRSIRDRGRSIKYGVEIDTLNAIGLDPVEVGNELWKLQVAKQLKIVGSDRAFHLMVDHGVWRNADQRQAYLEDVRDKLVAMMEAVETETVSKLDYLYETLYSLVPDTLTTNQDLMDDDLAVEHEDTVSSIAQHNERESQLQQLLMSKVTQYFQQGNTAKSEIYETKWGFRDPTLIEKQRLSKMALEISIKEFVKEHHQEFTSGRSIARIFHGLQSPKYTAKEW
eukprot:jgi/Hompol1/1339/HPOL_004683-RA